MLLAVKYLFFQEPADGATKKRICYGIAMKEGSGRGGAEEQAGGAGGSGRGLRAVRSPDPGRAGSTVAVAVACLCRLQKK